MYKLDICKECSLTFILSVQALLSRRGLQKSKQKQLVLHRTQTSRWWCLTFDPLMVGRRKKSTWTLLHLWPYWILLSTVIFAIRNSFKVLTFWVLTKRSPWTLRHLCPCRTCWYYFCHMKYFQILTFFDHWALIGRSDEDVTVDTFASLSM